MEALPLHLAVKNKVPIEIIRYLVSKWPKSVEVDRNRGLPLHWACIWGSPLDAVQFLVEKFPSSLSTQTFHGETPLHFAVENDISTDVLLFLVGKNVDALSIPNNSGFTPLDKIWSRALAESGTFDQMIVSGMKDPCSAWSKLVAVLRCVYIAKSHVGSGNFTKTEPNFESKSWQWLLSAAASTTSCPDSLLKLLCQRYPEFCVARDRFGRTPLIHAANTSIQPRFVPFNLRRSEKAISILLKRKKKAVRYGDFNGRLPLSYALESGKPWSIVRHILDFYPVSVQKHDPSLTLYMFQVAAMGSDVTVVYEILIRAPYIVSMARE